MLSNCRINIPVFYITTARLLYVPEVESRTQGSRPRPRLRTQKNPRPRTAFPRTDTLDAKDRNARGQGQGPRTQAQVLSKKKKVFPKIFQAISTKKRSPKNFSSAPQNFNNSKNSAVLEPRTGQFSRTSGQGQGLDLRGQGQGLQNVSSRTSSRTSPLIRALFAKTAILNLSIILRL